MKTKVIKSVLRKVHNSWAESIKDKDTRSLVEKNTIITGGCIASMLLQEEVNDYDIYFANAETVNAVAKYYLKEMKKVDGSIETARLRYTNDTMEDCSEEDFLNSVSGRVKIFIPSTGLIKIDSKKVKKFGPVFASANAITLKNKVQLVLRFWGEPKSIHHYFDYVHCMSYWTSDNGKLVIPQATAVSLLNRELKYHGSRYPLASIIRSRKFIQRGWKITAGEYLKMVAQLQELNLFSIDVLEEQLTGVDTAYFSAFITTLKAAVIDPEVKIDASYVIKMIDDILEKGDEEE